MTLRDILTAALQKARFFQAIVSVWVNVPVYDLDAPTSSLTTEEQQWLDEWINANT